MVGWATLCCPLLSYSGGQKSLPTLHGYPVLSGNQDSKEQFKKMFLCKHEDWGYENEWRMVNFLIDNEKDRLYEFPKNMLKKVVLGVKTKPYVKRLIKGLKIEMNMEFEVYVAKKKT